MKTIFQSLFYLVCASMLVAAPPPVTQPGTVSYAPLAKIVQGNQPLSESYLLQINTPSNIAAGSNLTIPLNLSVLSKPTGVSDQAALGFISLSPAVLNVTGPSQVFTVTVAVVVPTGNFAGDYAYGILASGWPSNLTITNIQATVNARVSPAGTVTQTPPAVTLLSPANNPIYTYYPATSTPASVPISFAANVPYNGQAIHAMRAFIGAVEVPVVATGLGTFNATATGTLAISVPGNYTIRVEATNNDGTSEASSDFTVVAGEAPPPPPEVCQNLTWLPPISLNKTIKGGSTMPIKFRLDCANQFVRDESTLIAIYEIYSDGSESEPVIYPYGTGSPNPPDYAITGNQYHLNFDTARGVHRYRIEVYHPFAGGTTWQLLGSKELLTKGDGEKKGDDKGSKDDDCDDDKKDKDKNKNKSNDKDKDCDDDKDDKNGKGKG